jgi:hypothetical protein
MTELRKHNLLDSNNVEVDPAVEQEQKDANILLEEILRELKIMNLHLSDVTNQTYTQENL